MRNIYSSSCCEGEQIVGRIIYGKKFPFGTVSEETYKTDMTALNSKVSQLNAAVTNAQSGVTANEAEIRNLKSGISDIRTQIGDLISTDAEHDREIAVLENSVSAAGMQLTEIRSAVSDLSTRVANYETAQATLRNQVLNVSDSLNSRCDSLSTSLNAVRQDVQELRRTVGELSISTATSIATINQRLANLEGGEVIGILSFTATPQMCEKGATENVILSWTTKGDVRSAKINGETVTGNTKTIANLSSTQEFTLIIEDAKGITDQMKIVVPFINHIYWGTDPSGLMTEGTVKGLDYSELSDVAARSIRFTVNNSYIYYSYPKRLGTVQFKVGQLVGGFCDPDSVVIDNHAGYTEEYYVYRSNQKLGVNGPVSVTVEIE